MNVEYRMLKVCMLSILIKRMSKAKPSFVILRFDIRYSAVRCLIQAVGQVAPQALPDNLLNDLVVIPFLFRSDR